jgi:hypothetical protein
MQFGGLPERRGRRDRTTEAPIVRRTGAASIPQVQQTMMKKPSVNCCDKRFQKSRENNNSPFLEFTFLENGR